MNVDLTRIDDDGAYREELRHLCRTDHFFLANLIGRDKFHPRIHGPVFKELYFPKNINLPIEKQHEKHFRIHLDPRGLGKTTARRVDSLQWICAFPEDVTMLNETATQPLGRKISQVIANYFYRPKGRESTPFQHIFPELIVDREPFSGKDSDSWNCPRHDMGDEMDSTIAYTSPMSVQSGWHPLILNPDDMVETKNSGIRAKPETRKGVIDTYDTNENLLLPGGYINIVGTRYHPEDLYGDILDKMDPEMWQILIRSAITVKDGTRLVPGEFPDEDDIVLNFPEWPGMDYRSLRAKFYKNYESYMCQQQNDPMGGNVSTFDEKLYGTLLCDPDRIPGIGDVVCFWRFPYKAKSNMQGSEGLAARLFDGKGYVLDAWGGDWTPSRTAEKVVKMCREQGSNHVIAEQVPGWESIESNIRNESVKRNVPVRVQWLELDEEDHLRVERIRQMEPQMRVGKILISSAAARLAEIHKQLVHFGLTQQNGLVDCMSRMARRLPLSIFRDEMEEEEKEEQLRQRDEVMAHFVFGHGQAIKEVENRAELEAEAHRRALESINTGGLTDILGGLDG